MSIVVIWVVDIVLDAVILRLMPGLETKSWITAFLVAVLVQFAPLPLPLLSGLFDIANPWVSAGVVFAVTAVLLTLSTVLFGGFRSHGVMAVPAAAAVFTGAGLVGVPFLVTEIGFRLGFNAF